MDKYKKVIKVKFEDRTIGVFAHSLFEALHKPIEWFLKGILYLMLGFWCIVLYPLYVIYQIIEYFNGREVYFVKVTADKKPKRR